MKQPWRPKSLFQSLHDWFFSLYQSVLKWSKHRHAERALFFISTIEAIFFPIPPDPLLVAMGASKPKMAFRYALVTTVASILGACIGYALGALAWEVVSPFFFNYVFSEKIFASVVAKFQSYTFVAIFLASTTPLPFKIFTVAGGVAKLPLGTFIMSALCGRGLRFFTIGTLLFFFGEKVTYYIERYFGPIMILFSLIIVAGFLMLRNFV